MLHAFDTGMDLSSLGGGGGVTTCDRKLKVINWQLYKWRIGTFCLLLLLHVSICLVSASFSSKHMWDFAKATFANFRSFTNS